MTRPAAGPFSFGGRFPFGIRLPRIAPAPGTDPQARIDVNLLADPWDVASMLEGIRLARRLASTEPLASLHRGEVSPDAVGGDADALTAVLKAGVTFYNHANGTVRMGPGSDPEAVVDATGNVRGIAGLSVADASIMPTPPSNPTTLTTLAIVEKIARELLTELYAAGATVPGAARSPLTTYADDLALQLQSP